MPKKVKSGFHINFIADNLALNKPADSSPRYSTSIGFPDRANDGDANPACCSSCSHTKFLSMPWWKVDLLQAYDVSAVEIVNRNAHRKYI